jgi:uncharacterized protein (DUF433 family)
MKDLRLAFGRPVIKGSRVTVAVVVDLLRAGESVARIAQEFGLSERGVRAAAAWQKDQRR